MINQSLHSSSAGSKNKKKNKAIRVALFVEAHEGLGHFNIIRQLSDGLTDIASDTEVMILSGTIKSLTLTYSLTIPLQALPYSQYIKLSHYEPYCRT